MKIFSQRIATFVACASVAYLASTPFVLGHRAGDAVEMNAADPTGQHTFNALNHDDPKTHHHHHNVDHHHGHHHHHKHHKKPHHKKPHHDKHLIAKKVHLVCDGKIIDTLKCPIKVCDAIAADVEAVDSTSVDASSNTFHAKNNGGTDSIPQVFIKMDLPCSKEPTKGCTADVPMANQDATGATKEFDPTETDDSEETELDETESEDSDAIDLAKRDDVADTDFEASNHGGGHKHRHHHHSRHHRHGKHHNHDKHHHHHKHGHHDKKHRHKNKHPWKDLCVAVGDFCGSSLYGCDFSHKTLYRCSAIGDRPIVIKVNAEECGGPPPVKKCPCPADFVHAVCGSELPEKCNADPTQIYHCPGGPLSEFEVLKKCPPGTVCVPGKDGNDATCGYESCECTGDKEYCSSQFPARCGLKKNTIYKCVGGKLTEVKSCDDTAQECVAVGDGAICGSCKCPSDGEICGDTFPLKCRLSATGLYKCKKGETPELVKECLPGYCSAASRSSIVFESEIDKDVCTDGCTCVREGDFCGRSFSPECGLDVNTLYKCSGPGVKPEVKEKCENGCIVKAGANVCNKKNDCTCPNTDPICGGDLPASCKADSNTIYVCRDGNGGTPEPIEICPPGKQCQKKPSPEGAVCGSDNCDCTGTGEICSDTFPDNCGLQKNTIYKCTAGGKPEKVKTCEGDKSCVSVSDGAVCVNCKCLDDGTVCGKIFPRNCNLKATALYTCKKGEDPVLQKDCYPNTCSPSKGAVFEAAGTNMDTCIDKCVCVGTGKVCGSTFHPDCKLRGSTLYKCEGKGTTPIELEKCKDGDCIVSNGDNKCANENKCTCPAGFDAVCGSELPVECQAAIKVEAGAVYYCPEGPGTLPQVKKICPPGHICQPKPAPEGATCGGSTCDCKGKHEVCSDTFPEDCKLEKNTIYKCSETGTPTKVKTCENGSQCITVADGAVCVRDDCKCTKDGEVCGAIFPSTCNLKHTAIYTCKKGEPPVLKTDCFPERCTASKSSMTEADATFQETHDVCSDSCVCEREGTMCGSSFQKKCQLASGSLYQCTGKGTKPTLLKECKDGHCIVKPGDDECAVDRDPCLCKDGKDHCGFIFPAKCHLDKEIVYKCPGGKGTKPVPGDKCKDGECTETADGAQCKDPCKCEDKKDVCGSTFPPECKLDADTVYKCTRKGADPVPGNKCKPGECMTGDPDDNCKPPPPVDCNCRDGDDICGSQYDDSCKFDKDTLYKCPGGKGTKPVPGDKCKTGVCQVNPTGPDKCKEDPCKCQDKKDVCGSTFPTECKLDADTVYSCSGKGADPVPGDKCKTGECAETAVGAKCKEDPCKCTDKKDVCGSTFPPECKLDADTVYKCTRKGADPVPGNKCKPGECMTGDPDDNCKPPPPVDCNCRDGDDICGSQYDDSCKFDKDTLYKCPGGKGTKPVPGDKCKTGVCQVNPTGPDKCEADPCKCKEKKDVCGHTFPTECKLDSDTVYSCSGKGADPVPGDKCTTGACMETSYGAKCKEDPCKCEDKKDVCGSTFPPECKLDADTVYKCSGKGVDPVPGDKCKAGECTESAYDATCKEDPCLCKDGKDHCGFIFPAKCHLDKEIVYKCPGGKGTKPVPGDKCKDGECTETADGAQCKDPCKCEDKKDVCGSTFPPECKLDADTVYKCSGKDVDPVPGDKCKPGECMTGDPNDACKPPPPVDCNCRDGDDICGSQYDDSCKFDKDTLYKCPGGKGTKPVPGDKCKTGECQVNPTGADKCKEDPCKCQDKMDVCGSTFPAECKLDADTVYSCSGKGADPVPGDKCKTGECTETAVGAKCKEDPCKCADKKDVCGSTFPPECKLDADTIYTCSGKGADPVPGDKCKPGECLTGDPNDACKPPPPVDCNCRDGDDICGSQYDDSCKFDKDTLYKCPGGKGTTPVPGDKCKTGVCQVNPTGPDKCEDDPCKCKEKKDICGHTFPTECKLDADTVYSCSGKGADPVPGDKCTTGACMETSYGAQCKEDPCKCQDKKDVCGSTFPAECKLDADTVYKCSGKGVDPVPGDKCKAGECIDSASGATCKEDPCLCKDGKDHCGFIFPATCHLDKEIVYKCPGGEGTKPVPGDKCKDGECLETADGAQCKDPCKCEDKKDVCGSTFPPECKLDADTVYKCSGKDVDPVPGDKCKPGECMTGDPNDACKPPPPVDCNCRDGDDICGSQYDDSCKFDKDTLYKCPGGKGTTPVPGDKCKTGECQVNPTGADKCKEDPCKCQDKMDVCGSTFPAECKLDADTVYSCSGKGADPVPGDKCKTGECTETAVGAKCKEDPCKCADKKNICGSTFPPECKLDADTVYTCSGKGADPVPGDKCKPGECLTGDPNDACKPPPPVDCNCRDGDDICGSQYDDSCKFDKDTLYKCPGGKGTTPVPGDKCKTGVCQVNPTGPDKCEDDPCKCKEKKDICGHTFPTECKLDADTVYSCSGKGVDPVPGDKCKTGECTETSYGAQCKEDPCKCQDKMDVCGSTFPPECKLDADTIYKCSGKGVDPVPGDKCNAGACIDSASGATCKDPCKCQAKKDVCGSTFPPECKLDADTVYKCSGKDVDPVPGDKCKPGECLTGDPNDACKPPPPVDCNCRDGDDICGSQYDDSCKFDKDTLYKCPGGKGTTPVPGDKCKTGECQVNPTGADKCKEDPCKCQDKMDVCGSTFPAECKLDADTVYKCSGKGVDPVPGDKCNAGACIDSASGATCKEDPCKCQDKVDVCGSTFPAECKLDADTVYKCSGKGVDPVPGDKCNAGECIDSASGATCKEDPCKCQDKVDVCGSTFPAECKLDADTVYKCSGKGVDPVPGDKCKAGECIDSASGATCKEDPCKCQDKVDVCGSTFPAECKLDADTVYKCSGKGVDPVPGDKCNAGACVDSASGATCKEDPCKCQDKVDVCGSTFPSECKLDADTVYKCSGKGVDPVPGDKCKAGECIDSASGATCKEDPCNCKGSTKVCGSTFDDSCNLEKTALFSCNGTGTIPTKLSNCTLGCELTSPDNKCKDCDPQVKNATTALDSVAQLLENAIKTGGTTAVVAAVLAKNVEKLKLDLPLAVADAVGLGAIAGPGKQLVGAASDLLDKLANGTADAATTALIDALRALVPKLSAVEECAGGNTTDCKSIIQLYKDIKTTAFDLLKGIPGVSTIIGPIITQLQNATDTIDTALESGSGALVGDAIGAIDVLVGTINTNPLLKTALAPVTALLEAAKAAIKCQLGIEIDKCALINKRFEGALAALIDIVKNNLDMIPIFGTYISTPVLDALKEAVIDVQKGGAGAIGTAAGTLRGLLQIINLAGGGTNLSNPITNAILSILGIVDGAGECSTGGDPCSGVIKIAKALISSAAKAIGDLIPGAGPILQQAINAFLNPLASALNTVSATAINTAVAALKIPGAALKTFVPSIGPAVDTLIGGLEMVAKCLTTGGQTNVPLMAAPTMAPTV